MGSPFRPNFSSGLYGGFGSGSGGSRPGGLAGGHPQRLLSGVNSFGAGSQFEVPPLIGSKFPLPGASATSQPRSGGAGAAAAGGGILSLLGGPLGAIGAGAAAIGTIAGLTARDPYKGIEQQMRKRFKLLRTLATRRTGRQQAASMAQARQRLSGRGMSDQLLFEQISQGYTADYGNTLNEMILGLRSEEEQQALQLKAGSADWRNQRAMGFAGLLGPGLNALLTSLNIKGDN